jgi:anti-sigma B factor antagonist
MDFSFRINEGPVDAETYALEPHGELDIATAPDLAAALDGAVEAGRRFVVLDLGDIGFLDASSLRVMLAAHRRLVENGGRLIIICSDRRLVRVFRVTGLVEVLSVTSSRREALSRAQDCARAA